MDKEKGKGKLIASLQLPEVPSQERMDDWSLLWGTVA